MWSNDQREADMYKKRKIYQQIEHALKHLNRGADNDKEHAINLLQQALDDHEKAVRRNDK